MKLLLDECLPVDLRLRITCHDVFTVRFMRWHGIKNGKLLALAAADGFDAFVTTDHAIEREQNAATLPLSVVILDAMSNDEDDLLPLIPALLKTLNHLAPRCFTHVSP